MPAAAQEAARPVVQVAMPKAAALPAMAMAVVTKTNLVLKKLVLEQPALTAVLNQWLAAVVPMVAAAVQIVMARSAAVANFSEQRCLASVASGR